MLPPFSFPFVLLLCFSLLPHTASGSFASVPLCISSTWSASLGRCMRSSHATCSSGAALTAVAANRSVYVSLSPASGLVPANSSWWWANATTPGPRVACTPTVATPACTAPAYYNLSLGSCVCAGGYYYPTGACSSAMLCPAGHFCPPGSTIWRDKNCGRGNYCPWGSSAPISCPPKGTVDAVRGPANGACLLPCKAATTLAPLHVAALAPFSDICAQQGVLTPFTLRVRRPCIYERRGRVPQPLLLRRPGAALFLLTQHNTRSAVFKCVYATRKNKVLRVECRFFFYFAIVVVGGQPPVAAVLTPNAPAAAP